MMKSRNRAQFLRVLVLVGAAVSTGHLWVAQGEPDSSSLLSSAIQTPSWASKLCAYGTLPGTWLESPQRPEDKPPPANHPQLLDKPGSEVGGRYRLLPNRGQCQLQNRLKQYLFPSPEHPEISLGRPLRVLSLGDSVDGQTEENICWMDALHDGRNSTTYVDADGRDYYTTLTPECTQQQQQQQQPGGARLSCLTQPTHTKTNLCITSRVHMYQRVVISLQPTFNETLFGDEWGFRGLPALVNETRDFVLRNSGAEDMDMVILGVHFWELAHLVDDTRPVEGIDGTTVPLPLSYLEAHMRRYSDFIALVRRAFPTVGGR
ncbi:hypothetical protein HYH02_013518 [Chlamydomonas schloesseri]|uniref:Uncharacterized protein n=1 Tax=Chlamydomonas schloesseri TaxID=2026947 RepID=A0A835T3M2_9CHLO|nr:hypothetical protein HYH02_013518 [Chlamydomonas schloesseri]|eukprot:KAG2430986.1 hypothetical protein HYH02_013518 [Chlamydomonas schloesseri]